jgi:thiamine pyrophosphate-dependent acetolactate synthase large subunit-like protein
MTGTSATGDGSMNRIECFKVMAELVGDALVVTGAGGNTVEWYACRPGDGNFRVRTMGLVSSIALGMALGLPHRRVVAIDGDGSLLMNLCSLPTIARKNPPNLTHVVLDNEVYEASGEIDTATGAGTDLVAMARGAGIRRASWAASPDDLRAIFSEALEGRDASFIGLKVETARSEVPPYPMDEVENKYRFIRHVEQTEGLNILSMPMPVSFLKD